MAPFDGTQLGAAGSDGLGMAPRAKEPESALIPGMAAPSPAPEIGPLDAMALLGPLVPPNFPDTSIQAPQPPGQNAQEPPRWQYDFDPAGGLARATFAGEIGFGSIAPGSGVTPSGPAGGALSGTYPNPGLAVPYPTTLPPNGPAGGVLSGTYPNPAFVTGIGEPMVLSSESVLAAPATSLTVAIPANARVVQLFYDILSTGAVNDAAILQVMQGGTPFTTANHIVQQLVGAAAVASAQQAGPLAGWSLGNGLQWHGSFATSDLAASTGTLYGNYLSDLVQAAGNAIVYGSLIGGGPVPNTATGFRLQSNAGTNFATGSTLRCLVSP